MNSNNLRYNKEDLENIFAENVQLIYSYIKRNKKYLFLFDSFEDMVQELSLKVWQALFKYNGEYAISTFVNKVLDNCCKCKVRDLNANKRKIYLESVVESDLPNGFEKILNEKYDAFNVFMNRYILENVNDMTRDYANGYQYKYIANKYNMPVRKVIRMIKKDARRVLKNGK